MNLRIFCFFCAICAFVAILNLPIGYYTFLRIVITIGALLVLIFGRKQIRSFWYISFSIILILYNPILPVYLYDKSRWIPLDIVTGILFLLVKFKEKENSKDQNHEINEVNNYQRDKIIKTNYQKNSKTKLWEK